VDDGSETVRKPTSWRLLKMHFTANEWGRSLAAADKTCSSVHLANNIRPWAIQNHRHDNWYVLGQILPVGARRKAGGPVGRHWAWVCLFIETAKPEPQSSGFHTLKGKAN